MIKPGDTSPYYSDTIPSLNIQLSKTNIKSQITGKVWEWEQSGLGKVWYDSITTGRTAHRVSNMDTGAFHLNKIEFLSPYDISNSGPKQPFGFPVIFENAKTITYRITQKKELQWKTMRSRGPLIVVLIAGQPVSINYIMRYETKEISSGHFLYIEPNTSFSFNMAGSAEMNMVMIEIK